MRARLVGLVLTGALTLVPAAAGSVPGCTVVNKSTRQSYGDLQSAVDAAAPGQTLIVQGTCTGTTTVSTDLTLVGKQSGGSAPTLDAEGNGSVLTIGSGIRVAVDSLTITGGQTNASNLGGGITDNGGLLDVSDSNISGNTAMFGGGIENTQGKVVVSDSTITDNTATVDGGGIDTFPSGTVSVRGATSISDNTAGLNGGGISHFGSGALTLRDSSEVNDNSAAKGGGGIYDANNATVTLQGASAVAGNTSGGDGGGINNHGGGTVVMHNSARVYDNAAGGDGGGIFNNGGRLRGVVPGANVYGNTPDDVA